MKNLFYLPLIFIFSQYLYADDNLSLREIYVITDVLQPGSISAGESHSFADLESKINDADTSSLLNYFLGTDVQQNGSLSGLIGIHGLFDDRVKISVDGIDLESSCTNHSDPDLTYLDINAIDNLKVFSGITPVSMGGDSLAGTITVTSKKPKFTSNGSTITGKIKSFYKSNNDEQGVSLSSQFASENFSVSYIGSYTEANNYNAGSNFKNSSYGDSGSSSDRSGILDDEVASTGFRIENHAIGLAFKKDNLIYDLKMSYQEIPYQALVNQRMDITDNHSYKVNFSISEEFNWGDYKIQAYTHHVEQEMNFGKNKQFMYGTAYGMPMAHSGETNGVNFITNHLLDESKALRYGAEIQKYQLEDWWNPTGTSDMAMMAPNTFRSINDGEKDKYSIFAELDNQIDTRWFSQVGLRYALIQTDADDVNGYSQCNDSYKTSTSSCGGMNMNLNYLTDSSNFNAANHKKIDHHLDLTGILSFAADKNNTYEMGYSIKNRSPNLYERYAWSTSAMTSSMINWVGDGNGYIGDVNLKKETAHTLGFSYDYHDEHKKSVELKINPYFTYIHDYIDAVSGVSRTDGFKSLTLGNQNAKIYGVDISLYKKILSTAGWGDFDGLAQLSYKRGINTDTNDDLYHMMPINLKFDLNQRNGNWQNTLAFEIVDSKNKVNDIRSEQKTSGYGLVNFRSNYKFSQAQINFSINNLFDRYYEHPLGGVYFGQGSTMSTNTTGITTSNLSNVPGMGRNIFTSIEYSF